MVGERRKGRIARTGLPLSPRRYRTSTPTTSHDAAWYSTRRRIYSTEGEKKTKPAQTHTTACLEKVARVFNAVTQCDYHPRVLVWLERALVTQTGNGVGRVGPERNGVAMTGEYLERAEWVYDAVK